MSNPSNKDLLRHFLEKSWAETYRAQIGDEVTSSIIAGLGDESLGGILSCNKEKVEEKVIVVMEDQHIVACCVYATRHDITYIWAFYVLQALQHMGIGRNIVELIIGRGLNQNTLQVTALQVSKDAVHFYERLGFLMTDAVQFQLTPGHEEPALTMKMRPRGYRRK
ncbi:GNAT family N-acetyltransferase [Celerinatantimonas yamalensis]|uniref:GNAT family N-acetyltransferase n=1 Tax=Celerinatantimonas yamalensis TaxID=559956 RepID=A0ABW9G5U8_9GAMM